MQVINKTKYRTDDLHKFFRAGFKAEGEDHKEYIIEVNHAKGEWVHGYAYYNSYNMTLHLPKDHVGPKNLAQVFVHELGHCLSLHHKDMMDVWEIEVPWIEGLAICKKEVKPKPKKDIQAKRYEHALLMLNRHVDKLAREKRLAKKWEQKVRYYEKAFEKRQKAASPNKREE